MLLLQWTVGAPSIWIETKVTAEWARTHRLASRPKELRLGTRAFGMCRVNDRFFQEAANTIAPIEIS
jgi:hypothetical protein